jgi:hypothetical protein
LIIAFTRIKVQRRNKISIEDEYDLDIDLSKYPPTKTQILLKEMQKELEFMSQYTEKEIKRIQGMKRKTKKK